MSRPFAVIFSNQQVAYAVRVQRIHDLRTALESLHIPYPKPTLVLVGGASGISLENLKQIRHLFTEVLAPLAESLGLAIIDGGTDVGIMRLIGQARHQIAGTFPLIGVAARGTISLPHIAPFNSQSAPLEPYHSHFLLVLGARWGKESPWIARTASMLAEGKPSATLLINGGEITWKDAEASIKAKRTVIVAAGSGRTADQIAAAQQGIATTDKRARKLSASGLLQIVHLSASSGELNNVLKQIFNQRNSDTVTAT